VEATMRQTYINKPITPELLERSLGKIITIRELDGSIKLIHANRHTRRVRAKGEQRRCDENEKVR
jgi:hypothetical protein